VLELVAGRQSVEGLGLPEESGSTINHAANGTYPRGLSKVLEKQLSQHMVISQGWHLGIQSTSNLAFLHPEGPWGLSA
jgi:hypothetical protein